MVRVDVLPAVVPIIVRVRKTVSGPRSVNAAAAVTILVVDAGGTAVSAAIPYGVRPLATSVTAPTSDGTSARACTNVFSAACSPLALGDRASLARAASAGVVAAWFGSVPPGRTSVRVWTNRSL